MKGLGVPLLLLITPTLLVALDQERTPEEPVSAQSAAASPMYSTVQSQNSAPVFPDWIDFGGLMVFFFTQFAPAKVTDTFPTPNLLFLDPNTPNYKLKICSRAAVTDCMPTGTSLLAASGKFVGAGHANVA
jgi:hypothetical protein